MIPFKQIHRRCRTRGYKIFLKNYPQAYIEKKQAFYYADFFLNNHVLIPRASTETLIENILLNNPIDKKLKILDIGTGSGCLAITIKHHRPAYIVYASDASQHALRVARYNAQRLKTDIKFIHSNFFSSIEEHFDLIVANMPYVNKKDTYAIESSIYFEPSKALFAKKNGYYALEKVIQGSIHHLAEQGQLYLEFGYNQAYRIKKFMKRNGFTNIKIFQDLEKLNRSISGSFFKI